MNIVLFDEPQIRKSLLPFTFTRPVGNIRIGILTIAEKWKLWLNTDFSFLTENYLQAKYPNKSSSDNYFINGAVCPDADLTEKIRSLNDGEGLVLGGTLIAARTRSKTLPAINELKVVDLQTVIIIDRVWKIFQQNGNQIRADFKLITANRISRGIQDEHTRCYNVQDVFVEEGVNIRAAILNAEHGPIYLGKNSHVHEGAIIRGPFAMGEGSHVNMGAKVRGDTSLGPFCKIGGEVSNSVIFGYSNKAHDGFLGNSVIGEWCNVGADTNTSNLKNNFQSVKLWSYATKSMENSGLLFCGLMMGDHSKCGINTMFNTGTVTGVCANIFGEGYPKKFIPSFTWGGANESDTYNIEKALEAIGKGMERRNKSLGETDKNILKEIYAQTAEFRTWEN